MWYSIPDKNIPVRRLRKQWQLAGLDAHVLPSNRQLRNVFRSVLTEMKGKSVREDGTTAETEVTFIRESAETIVYQISRIVKDFEEELVDFPKAMRVTMMKRTEEIKFRSLGGVPRQELLPMMEAIQDSFDRAGTMLPGRAVRELVRRYLTGELFAESLNGRSGGIYFVPAVAKEQLDQLGEAVGSLYPDAGYLNAIPLADSASERELIRRNHKANVMAEAKEALADVSKLLREGRVREVRSDVALHHQLRLKGLQRRAQEYQDLLEEENDDVSDVFSMLGQQLRGLS
jgi:hypothetical protein